MAETWMVTQQTERTRMAGREVVRVMEVGFVTSDGDTGWVDVPLYEYTPENVATQLHALATGLAEVRHNPSVHTTSVSMRNDWIGGVETPMVVVEFTTPTGAVRSLDIPAATFDPQAAIAHVDQVAATLDAVAGL